MPRSLLMVIALWLAWAGSARSDSFEGLPVVDIEFSPPAQPIPPARLKELVAVRVAAPLDAENVRNSIQQLFATGRYTEIQVDAVRVEGGVKLTFITIVNWFIGPVKILGVKLPPSPGQLVTATNLVLGEAYSPEKQKAAEENLRRLLRDNGLFHAAIEADTGGHSDTQQIDITFQITPGERAHFGEVQLRGKADLTVEQIRRIAKWSPRTYFTQPNVQRGLDRLRRHYQRADHLQAVLRLAEQNFVPGSNRVDVVLEVEPGPRVDVALSGAKLSHKRLRRYIPIYEEGTIDRDLLIEGRRNLTDYFQTKGYFEAKVDYDQHPEAKGEIVTEFQTTLGERHEFVKLEITGNRFFDLATIRERMFLQPKNFQFRRGRFSQSLLRSDVAAIEELYRSNGFLEVKVTARPVDDYLGKKGRVAVFIQIEEGRQTLVSHLKLTGNSVMPAERLLEQVSSLPGQPFSDSNVAADRDQVLALYFSEGFADASLEWRSAPAAEPNLVELEYIIREGQRQFVNRVIVEGQQSTRQYVIDRQLQVFSASPLSQSAMIESQRRLYDLGIFSKVDMAVQNPEGGEQFKNVLFELEEARRWTLGFGGGAEIARFGGGEFSLDSPAGATGFSPRAAFEVNRLNMFGRANTLSFRSRVSTLQKRGLVSYQAPQWRGKERLTLTYSSLYDNSKNIRTFSATRLEGALQLQHKISKPASLFYRYSYRRVSVDSGTLKIDPLLIPLLSQPVRVGLLSVSYAQDRRDDPVDARRGIYNSVDLGVASFYTGSEASFLRSLVQNSTYHPLTRRLVLARTTQLGALVPYGRLRRVESSGEVRFTHELPLPERFFSGGSNSNRGFPVNQAGPRDLVTGFPVGGNGLIFNSVEARFPVRGENIGGVLFHDMGNVFSRPQNFTFRVKQRDLQDFDYMVHAVGVGVRYRTPIGPVRVDVAYGINSPRFVGFKGSREDLLFGRGTKSEQRIAHFQFHFSLGQTF